MIWDLVEEKSASLMSGRWDLKLESRGLVGAQEHKLQNNYNVNK